MNPETKQIIADIQKYKGRDFALLLAVEEMAELTQALMKSINRHKEDLENLAEETADVLFCLEFVKTAYGMTDARLSDIINEKAADKWTHRIEKWKARVADTGDPDSNKRIID